MAKNSIRDFDNTAGNNTDIQSVDIAENCAPSGINNAIRELMADMADVNDGTVALVSPAMDSADINGGTIDGTVIGGTTPAAGNFTTGSFTGDVSFGDSDKAIFGAGSDLQIYHDGSDSYITDTTGGNLFINEEGAGYLMMKGSDLYFRNPSNADMIHAQSGGYVKLYHNGAEKLATTSTGIDVTGTVTSDGLTVDGAVDISYGDYQNSGAIKIGADLGQNTSRTDASRKFGAITAAHFDNDEADLGLITMDSSSTSVSALTIGGGSSSFNSASTINFQTSSDGASAGTTAMVIDASQNVGIGTSSPSSYAKFTLQGLGTEAIPTDSLVQSNDASTLQTIWNSDNSANYSGIKLETRTSAASGWLIANEWKSSYLGDLVFRGRSGASTSAERMRIDSSGNTMLAKSSTNTLGTVGHDFGVTGYAMHTRASSNVLYLNRTTSDGNIAEFYKDGSPVGSIAAAFSDLAIGNGDTGLHFNSGSEQINPWNLSTNLARDNGINLGASGARFKDLFLSGSVYLGGTGSANALDDYEEGTWTPTNAGATLTVSSAKYTKIGRLVNVSCLVTANANTSGDWGGLPFTMDVNGIYSGSVGYQNDTAGETWNVLADSGTSWTMRKGATSEQLASGKNMRMSLTYYTT